MIFQKIARLLKSEINGNSWHVGDLLPSEAELAVRYNVSRNTLRKALSLLEGEGIIHRKHGSGTYIQKKNFVAHIDHMNSFSEIAHKSGKEAGSQIMKFEVQDASPTIATELNLVTGEQVYYIKRLRFIEFNLIATGTRKRSIPRSNEAINPIFLYLLFWIFIHPNKACMPYPFYDV